MTAIEKLAAYVKENPATFGKVVDLDPVYDKLYPLDLTLSNTELTPELLADTAAFSEWVNQCLAVNKCRYAIGGYMEHRAVYTRSQLFNAEGEPRRLHLGVDIWGPAGTIVYAPVAGTIHSFADNNHFGDYGPTIILQHQFTEFTLYSLYGHLSRKSLEGLHNGMVIQKNQPIGTFGDAGENGSWPPHLHFQLMLNIGDARGDYPGVGYYSRLSEYEQNIPDPEVILNFAPYVQTWA
ncbi:peptidase M23 [Mucilaginibacter sp. MD40]|uniref:peptidoglycan DD-metalloendopeptidase family protein n=1 Tax=Mucilaginibacter sp. MD40 TaxID=2029590 RepID=UPI000BAC663E|nr:peptidoglycan DD-metalloendopeptidase family protein [Mucilaginibacter sp. MD40]PAW93031.1 peptidase M23 [Mucilaginibacter sp. MD40]